MHKTLSSRVVKMHMKHKFFYLRHKYINESTSLSLSYKNDILMSFQQKLFVDSFLVNAYLISKEAFTFALERLKFLANFSCMSPDVSSKFIKF